MFIPKRLYWCSGVKSKVKVSLYEVTPSPALPPSSSPRSASSSLQLVSVSSAPRSRSRARYVDNSEKHTHKTLCFLLVECYIHTHAVRKPGQVKPIVFVSKQQVSVYLNIFIPCSCINQSRADNIVLRWYKQSSRWDLLYSIYHCLWVNCVLVMFNSWMNLSFKASRFTESNWIKHEWIKPKGRVESQLFGHIRLKKNQMSRF